MSETKELKKRYGAEYQPRQSLKLFPVRASLLSSRISDNIARTVRAHASKVDCRTPPQEEEFHLKQAMERSTIRLKEGRAKPIDILYQNLNASHDKFDLSMTDPTVVFAGLSVKELQALHDDITSHASLADNDTHRQFWRSLLVLASAELKDAKVSFTGDGCTVARFQLSP